MKDTDNKLNAFLFLTFLVLKLTGVINWNWIWVTAPLWAPLAMAIITTVTVGLEYCTKKILS